MPEHEPTAPVSGEAMEETTEEDNAPAEEATTEELVHGMILTVLRDVMNLRGLRDDNERVSFQYRTPSGVNMTVAVSFRSGCLVINVHLPICVPEDRRDEMSKLLIRFNFRFTVGGFEMDYSDGEILYYIGCPVGMSTCAEVVRSCVSRAMSSCSECASSILKLIYSQSSTAEEVFASYLTAQNQANAPAARDPARMAEALTALLSGNLPGR